MHCCTDLIEHLETVAWFATLGATTGKRRKEKMMKHIVQAVRNDVGAATAEYAITILAAVGFAGLLVVILRSDAVRQMLTDLLHRALSFAG